MVQAVVPPDWGAVVADEPDVAGLVDGLLPVDLELPQAARVSVATSRTNQKPSPILLIRSPFHLVFHSVNAVVDGATLAHIYDRRTPNGFGNAPTSL
jgi:hypothetical protein